MSSLFIILLMAFFAFLQLGKDLIYGFSLRKWGKEGGPHAIMLAIVFIMLFSYDVFLLPKKHKETQTANAKSPILF